MNTVRKVNPGWLNGDGQVTSGLVIYPHDHVAAWQLQLAAAVVLPITRPGRDQNSNFKVQFPLNTLSRHRKAEKSEVKPSQGGDGVSQTFVCVADSLLQHALLDDKDHFDSHLHPSHLPQRPADSRYPTNNCGCMN